MAHRLHADRVLRVDARCALVALLHRLLDLEEFCGLILLRLLVSARHLLRSELELKHLFLHNGLLRFEEP